MGIESTIEKWHPKLKDKNWKIININKDLDKFNCFSFVIDIYNDWCGASTKIWHNQNDRHSTILNYIQFYSTYNYKICNDDIQEPEYDKIAIYAINNNVSHVCKQFGGMWRSKLGSNVIIEHKLEWLSGADYENYGDIVVFMKRSK